MSFGILFYICVLLTLRACLKKSILWVFGIMLNVSRDGLRRNSSALRTPTSYRTMNKQIRGIAGLLLYFKTINWRLRPFCWSLHMINRWRKQTVIWFPWSNHKLKTSKYDRHTKQVWSKEELATILLRSANTRWSQVRSTHVSSM